MANQWFRMYADFRSDPKVRTMSEALQLRLAWLYCLRCEGPTENLSEDEIRFALGLSDTAELARTQRVFMDKGFIGDHWEILNWDKRQFTGSVRNSDSDEGTVCRRRGYVYYVADSSNFVANRSRIKIGFSSNPWARVTELRVANPSIILLGVEIGDQYLEGQRHEQFKHLRITREWFKDDPALRIFVATLRSSDEMATTEQNRTDKKHMPKLRAIRAIDPVLSSQCQALYAAYPRRIAPDAAYRAIAKALRKKPFAELMPAVERFATQCQRNGTEAQFIPYPATWFNAGRYNDEDLAKAKVQFAFADGSPVRGAL